MWASVSGGAFFEDSENIDYIAEFLAEQGIRMCSSFWRRISDLIESFRGLIRWNMCCQHEQSAAMAADAYSRISENLGAAVATSGPGITNMSLELLARSMTRSLVFS